MNGAYGRCTRGRNLWDMNHTEGKGSWQDTPASVVLDHGYRSLVTHDSSS